MESTFLVQRAEHWEDKEKDFRVAKIHSNGASYRKAIFYFLKKVIKIDHAWVIKSKSYLWCTLSSTLILWSMVYHLSRLLS